jgi:nucleotide-binding universal stress UspA family protein
MEASTTASASAPFKVLIALELDETADWALLEGFRLCARREACELHVVHALGDPGYSAAEDTLRVADHRFGAASDLIRRRVERLSGEANTRQVIAHIHPGRAIDAILQVAIDIGADVVVVGSHQRTGVERFVLGSVAERVLRNARCPVLVAVPKDHGAESPLRRMAPPCLDCTRVRRETQNATYWCERHSKVHLKPHVYEPRREGRTSLMPTY